MGNSLGGKKTVKIMKINGDTFKLKTPVKAGEVVKDYPAGYVLLESESVKHYGIRAKPLELHQTLEPKRLYFLVELPKFPQEIKGTRRVRSGIQMSAKDKLESLMLTRRSASDLSIMKPSSMMHENSSASSETGPAVRVRMMLPKGEVAKLMEESRDEAEAAQKILDLCLAKRGNGGDDGGVGLKGNEEHQQVHRESGSGIVKEGYTACKKRVSFMPAKEGEIQLAVASS